MKTCFLAISILLIPVWGFADALRAKVRFVRDGIPVELSTSVQTAASAAILSTLKATGYDATSYAGSKKQWRELSSKSYLVLVYEEPVKIIGNWNRSVLADEVLIPLSKDDYYLVRNTRSGKYWAFTKMLPQQRFDLVCREEFLIEENVSFCEVMRANKN